MATASVPLTTIPDTGFLRTNQVLGLLNVGRTTLWRWISTGRFPAPHKLAGGSVAAFRAEDVRAWIDQQGMARAA